MGDDLRVANAARVSMGKWKEHLDQKDERLIQYLADHQHWTPFAHSSVSIRETVPIFLARQRFKHTIGFVYNEVSRRYVSDEPVFYRPVEWRAAAENVKQGSGETLDDPVLFEVYDELIDRALSVYKCLLSRNAAPEMARMVLPQSMMTSYIVTGSLYAWSRAYKLRSDGHAQKEIQGLAEKWNDIIQPLFPNAWGALIKD